MCSNPQKCSHLKVIDLHIGNEQNCKVEGPASPKTFTGPSAVWSSTPWNRCTTWFMQTGTTNRQGSRLQGRWRQDYPWSAFDSSVGRAEDCRCLQTDILRSLVQIRLEGRFLTAFHKVIIRLLTQLSTLRKVVQNTRLPWPGIEPGPRRWERRILATRPPGTETVHGVGLEWLGRVTLRASSGEFPFSVRPISNHKPNTWLNKSSSTSL